MSEPKDGTGVCLVCNEDVPSEELVDHLRVMHPDVYEPPLTWPTGERVVVDESELYAWLEGGENGDE